MKYLIMILIISASFVNGVEPEGDQHDKEWETLLKSSNDELYSLIGKIGSENLKIEIGHRINIGTGEVFFHEKLLANDVPIPVKQYILSAFEETGSQLALSYAVDKLLNDAFRRQNLYYSIVQNDSPNWRKSVDAVIGIAKVDQDSPNEFVSEWAKSFLMRVKNTDDDKTWDSALVEAKKYSESRDGYKVIRMSKDFASGWYYFMSINEGNQFIQFDIKFSGDNWQYNVRK